MLDSVFWFCGGTGILCGMTRGAMLAVAPAAVNGPNVPRSAIRTPQGDNSLVVR